jgi:DNA-binding LytR/AlgR family response regulator
MNPLPCNLLPATSQKHPFLDQVASFDNPLDAMEFLSANAVDLIFLDIHMPDLSGIEFTRLLESRPKIVFTTAYEKYALEGFKLEAVDYLLKPFSYEEFLKAAKKAEKLIRMEKASEHEEIEANSEFLFLKSDIQNQAH